MRANAVHKFSSKAKSAYMGRVIASWNNRSNASARIITTTLRDIRNETEINSLKYLDQPKIDQYIDSLRDRLENGELKRSATSARISALNVIIKYADLDIKPISASKEGLSRGGIDTSDKSNSREAAEAINNVLIQRLGSDPRNDALYHSLKLQETFGLRAQESLAIKIADKDPDASKLIINKSDMPKASRPREIPIRNDHQRQVLREAKEFAQRNGWTSLIEPSSSLSQGKNYAYNTLADIRQEAGYPEFHFHGERHYYAHERFTELYYEKTGETLQCPAVIDTDTKGWRAFAANATGLSIKQIRDLDKEIRLEISGELGHGRIDVTRYYLG